MPVKNPSSRSKLKWIGLLDRAPDFHSEGGGFDSASGYTLD